LKAQVKSLFFNTLALFFFLILKDFVQLVGFLVLGVDNKCFGACWWISECCNAVLDL